ncbi:hypothetical protein B296_00000800 [Ensete ventricosum]|uniref:O-methyltransferase dimerisation domain-containing protein n=1 Tax=Ensete ventricosum TaxID=4639 RepID=A0A426ZUS5_ENSVE|nr:hypothetical protein B296_00000800 [Ensete ventricosum]
MEFFCSSWNYEFGWRGGHRWHSGYRGAVAEGVHRRRDGIQKLLPILLSLGIAGDKKKEGAADNGKKEGGRRKEHTLWALFVGVTKIERMIVLPITVKAVVELELLEIIVKAGPGAKPSPADVVSRMPTENPEAVAMVDRILCLLAAHGIVSCSVVIGNDGHPSCKYGTAPVCKYLTKNEDDVSLAPLSL